MNEYFPFVIGWELTLNCNLQCKHCASSAGRKRADELSLKESLQICDQFPELFVEEVVFTGGEPLLNHNWDTISSYLNKSGIKTGMVTNGSLISDEIISRMTDSGLNGVGISLDGTESIHDQIRGISGMYGETLRSIEKCASGGINVTVITMVSGLNIHDLDTIFNVVQSSGAWKWQLQPIFELGRSRINSYLYLNEEQFLEMGMFIHQKRAQKKGKIEIVPADSCGYCSLLDFPEFGWNGCGAGRYSCGIMSDGRIKGCLSWPDEFVTGDLRNNDLWSIWFQKDSFSNLRSFTEEELGGNCRNCEKANECRGGCQAMSLGTTGNWMSDPYCYHSLLKKYPHSRVHEYISKNINNNHHRFFSRANS